MNTFEMKGGYIMNPIIAFAAVLIILLIGTVMLVGNKK